MGNFAVSDLHGCFTQWRQIQSFCKDSDRIFVLGDCVDRLATGFNTLKSVLNDPRTTMLCGNHEDMMAYTLAEERDEGIADFHFWFSNGGQETYDNWCQDGRKFEWITVIQHLPTHASYINIEGKEILMNHSGVMPKPGYGMSTCGRQALLWDRKAIREQKWHYDENQIIIHGHTPIPLMPQFKKFTDVEIEPGAFWYCEGHRCNIDTGSCWTGAVCLLNLDTFEEHIFMG